MTATTGYKPRERGGPDLRGNARDRARRRQWLVDTFRADVDVDPYTMPDGSILMLREPLGTHTPACRCYRCGELLTIDTLTVDRIELGVRGGRYTRDNIRPACEGCNKSTGSVARWENEGRPW